MLTAEINFELLTKNAHIVKPYTPLAKYPPIIEDVTIVVDEKSKTGDIIQEIKKQNSLIVEVNLQDMYKDSRTFHIVYQDRNKNLSSEEVGKIREKIIKALQVKFDAKIK